MYAFEAGSDMYAVEASVPNADAEAPPSPPLKVSSVQWLPTLGKHRVPLQEPGFPCNSAVLFVNAGTLWRVVPSLRQSRTTTASITSRVKRSCMSLEAPHSSEAPRASSVSPTSITSE